MNNIFIFVQEMSWRSRIANLQKSDLLGLTHPPGAPRPDRQGDLSPLTLITGFHDTTLMCLVVWLSVTLCLRRVSDADSAVADIEERVRERRRARARRRGKTGEVRKTRTRD